MGITGRLLAALVGGLIALLPPADAATCKGGKRLDSAGRCNAMPAKKASTKAKAKAKTVKNVKAAAPAPDRGALYVFVESGGCRILATESSVRRMQEIAVGGSVTWDGRCAEGLISGTGVLRQEGVFIEGGRSKHFAYYYSGRAKNGVRTGQWTRESLERFDDSVRSWTSLARVEFVNGVAKGAPKPIPVRGADQHTRSFTARVLDPEAKRAQTMAETTPPTADADALRLRAAANVATGAAAVAPAAPPPTIPALPPPTSPGPPKPAWQATASAASPTAPPLPPKAGIAPPAPTAVLPPPTVPPRPETTPAAEVTPRETFALPTPSPAVAPAPTPAVPEPAEAAAVKPAPARPVVVAAPPPPAAVKLAPAMPDSMEKQAFGFGTGCYMDTLDGQLWENALLTVKDRKSLRIDGWAVDDEERVLAEATYLRLEGSNGRRYYAATTVQERPDVARHFGNPVFARAGYRAVFSAEGLPPGEYEATIVMNSKGRNLLCGNGRRLKL